MKKPFLLKHTLLILSAICFLSVIFSSCTKGADDETIIYSTFNKTITGIAGSTLEDSLDFNLDSRSDIFFRLKSNTSMDSLAIFFFSYSTGFYIDSTLHIIGPLYSCKSLGKNETPNLLTTRKEWSSAASVVYKSGADITGDLSGKGDQFIPVLLFSPISSSKHYGWIRINISSDYKTLKIIDGAYSAIPDVAIKMGAK
ncbi:MAG: hypothetical protein U0T77_02340 [Chitinophagales bacterium]